MSNVNEKVDKYVGAQKKDNKGFEQDSWDSVKKDIPEASQADAEIRAKELLR